MKRTIGHRPKALSIPKNDDRFARHGFVNGPHRPFFIKLEKRKRDAAVQVGNAEHPLFGQPPLVDGHAEQQRGIVWEFVVAVGIAVRRIVAVVPRGVGDHFGIGMQRLPTGPGHLDDRKHL